MAVFLVNTTVQDGRGGTIWFALDHPAADVRGVLADLSKAGHLYGDRLVLSVPRDGARTVIRREEVAIFPPAVLTIQPWTMTRIEEWEA